MEKRGLIAGRVLQRYKRFFADVEMEDGCVVTAHCTNTGTMKTCWEPGDLVLLEPASNPDRKLKYTWLACRREGAWVGVDTGMPNRVVAEAARRDTLPGLPGLREIRTEVKYGLENSRIDVLAKDADGRMVYIEVKNTTLRVGELCCFPDAVTARGTKHLRELQTMVRAKHRAVIVFCIHRSDVTAFAAARDIDPVYAETLACASLDGVEVLPLGVRMDALRDASGTWTLAWTLPGLLPWMRDTEATP